MANFFWNPEFEAEFQRDIQLVQLVPNFLTTQKKSPHAKSQFDSSSRFDTTPACDGQTDGHTTTAYTALAKAEMLILTNFTARRYAALT